MYIMNDIKYKSKQILYIDMDGVIVDLDSEIQRLRNKWLDIDGDMIHGVFRNPPPIKDAIESVKKLIECDKYEVFIATTSPWNNPESASDKVYWIQTYFGDLLYKKVIITHHKYLLQGDILIDDRKVNGEKFKGTFIHFGTPEVPDWKTVCDLLL